MVIAFNFVGGQNEFLSRLQLDESVVNDADTNLRSLQVLKDRHRLVERFPNAFDFAHELTLIFRRAMGKIESRHIHPRGDQFRDHLFGIGGRTDRANNLCPTHHLPFESFCLAPKRSNVSWTSGASDRIRCASSAAAIASLTCPIFS